MEEKVKIERAEPRRYSDAEKVQALAALEVGSSISAAARAIGMPRKTLSQWGLGQAIHPSVAEASHEKALELAGKFESIAHRIVDAMPGKIGDANLAQAATAAGIAVDKMRLLRGEATSNIQITATINIIAIQVSLQEAAQAAGLAYSDAVQGAIEYAEEQGDRELQRALGGLLEPTDG